MKRTHDTSKRSRKRLIIGACVLLALSILITVPYISFGAYNQSLSAQRTVAAYDKEAMRFSSNHLAQISQTRTVYAPNAQTTPTCLITVCNYPQGRPNKPATAALSYTVTAKFVLSSGADASSSDIGAYTATIRKGTDTVFTLSGSNPSVPAPSDPAGSLAGTLSANTADSHTFTLTFDVSFLTYRPDLCVEVTATPVGGQGLSPISAVFKPDLRAERASNSWTGAFSDDANKTPAEYDGFNYTISGSGRGTGTLTWDTTKVTLSYVSQTQLLAIAGAQMTTDGNNATITFPVDSDVEGHYDLQFYKVNITDQTWIDMGNSVVKFHFH